MTNIVCALDAKALLGEGPLWDPAAKRLYWVDIKRRQLHRCACTDGRGGRDVPPLLDERIEGRQQRIRRVCERIVNGLAVAHRFRNIRERHEERTVVVGGDRDWVPH